MNQLGSAFTLFLSLLVEAMPFLLLGVLLSSLMLLFIDESRLIALMPKHPLLGALAGGVFGFLFPVCECGNIPVARRLIAQGAPPAVAVGFLLSAPTVNPITIWATWTAFRDRPEVVLWRVGLSLIVAVAIGAIFSAQADIRPFLQPAVARMLPLRAEPAPDDPVPTGTFFLGEAGKPLDLSAAIAASPIRRKPWRDRLALLVENTVLEFRELGSVLVLGSAIAAAIQVGVPRDIIVNLGQGPVSSVLAMMVLAAIVSICSTVDAFFALSFAGTFTTGSLLAFLVFGPTIDLKAIGLILTVFKRRAVIYLFLLAAQMVFLMCLFLNLHVE